MSRWPEVAIGEVADPVDRSEAPTPGATYRQIGVRLWGEGAYERESIDGAETRYKTLNRLEAGDIIVNKIWARNGSVSVVSDDLAGCFCSGEFPLFRPRPDRLDPGWFYWITKTRWFWERCDEQSRGTSGKNRLRPQKFLEIPIPLAPLGEQRRVVRRIEQLAAQRDRGMGLRARAAQETHALLAAYLNMLFGNPHEGMSGTLRCTTFMRLGDASVDVADGPHVTPQYVPEGVPFITVQNITSGKVDFRRAKMIAQADHERYSRRAKAQRGDVLISKDGATRGIPCCVDTDREFSYFVSVALVKPRRDLLDGGFLAWAIRSPYLQRRICERSRGDMIPHIVLGEIRQLLVPCPTLEEQRRVASILNKLHGTIHSMRVRQSDAAERLAGVLPAGIRTLMQ